MKIALRFAAILLQRVKLAPKQKKWVKTYSPHRPNLGRWGELSISPE